MEFMKRYVRIMDAISEFLGQISMYVVPVTIVVGFGNVVLRYVGEFIGQRLTNNVFIELQWYLYTLIFLFGFAYILKNSINVRVDFWFENQDQRTKAWIDFVGHLIALLPFCLLALYVSWDPVMKSWGLLPDGTWGTWEVSPDPNGLPRAPIKSMILLGFSTLFLQGVAEVFKLVGILRGDKELGQVEQIDAPIRIE